MSIKDWQDLELINNQNPNYPLYLANRLDYNIWVTFKRPLIKGDIIHKIVINTYGETNKGKEVSDRWVPKVKISEYNKYQFIKVCGFQRFKNGHYYSILEIESIDDSGEIIYRTGEVEIILQGKRQTSKTRKNLSS